MLYRYVQTLDTVSTTQFTNIENFEDAHLIANCSKEAMAWAVNTGLLRGNLNNQLSPNAVATRAEVATLVNRFIQLIEKLIFFSYITQKAPLRMPFTLTNQISIKQKNILSDVLFLILSKTNTTSCLLNRFI